jgi:putative ABC transport system permease protein
VLGILYALLAMSIVIAILGIVNTLALSIIERTREIGLMRAVGLGRLQLAVTITIESVVIAVFGAAVGLLIGVGVASALPSVLSSSGLSALAIPWGQLGGFLLLSALVGVLAAVVPAIRAARLPVLKAIVAE